MIELAERFHALSADQKRIVHLDLCEHALSKWTDFSSSRWWITYAESVCGTKQPVDKFLPRDALRSAHDGRVVTDVDSRYSEPIAAMRDEDLNFPKHVEYAYYAIYNAFKLYAQNENIDDWLIVNQSLSSQTDETKRLPLLLAALEKAM